MTKELDSSAALLLDELRSDVDEVVDEAALTRVRKRLYAAAKPRVLNPARVQQRRSVVARGGLVAALLVGTALGAGGHALVSYVIAPTVPPPLPAAPPASAKLNQGPTPVPAAPAPATLPALPSAVVGVISASTTGTGAANASAPVRLPVPHAAASAPTPDVDAELRGLEEARRALAAGNAAEALMLVERHAQGYPQSMLQQEREALAIKALVSAGRMPEARAAAQRFGTKYPRSLLLDSVNNAVGTIP